MLDQMASQFLEQNSKSRIQLTCVQHINNTQCMAMDSFYLWGTVHMFACLTVSF